MKNLFAGLIALSLIPAAAMAAPVRATTDAGVIVGDGAAGINTFRGVPFAKPPVRELRWAAPQRMAPWTRERAATENGHACLQRAAGGAAAAAANAASPSEDCLYLNIQAPANARGAPVMVWIHGGSNTGGSGSRYNGEAFAKDGIVFVAINYRLGNMGFFAHPALTVAAGPSDPLGSFGLMDQVAALEWVQRNIAAFGGDPRNVTAFGESAGAMDLFALITMERTRGLFSKVIMESNIGWGGAVPLAQHEQQGVAFATEAGLTGNVTAAQLRALPADKVMGIRGWTGTTLDGRLVKEAPYEVVAAGRAHDIPLMIGWNSYEASLGGSTGETAARFTDGQAGAPARFIARSGAPGANTWLYHFSYVPAATRATAQGAAHASEIPYVFNYGRGNAEDQAVGTLVHSCWAAFAKSGVPTCASGQAWPAYTAAGDQLMEFGVASGVRTNFRLAELNAVDRSMGNGAQAATGVGAAGRGVGRGGLVGRGALAGRGGALVGRGGAGRGAAAP